jgi:hypothetical protein
MLSSGTDTYGPVETGLFISILNRQTYDRYDTLPKKPEWIRSSDRVGVSGCNVQDDVELYDLMYQLTSDGHGAQYAAAADKALASFINRAQNNTTKLLGWGEHLYYDTETDMVDAAVKWDHELDGAITDEIWEALDKGNSENLRNFAVALWEEQVNDQTTGAFNRHSRWDIIDTRDIRDYPRHAGNYMYFWAKGYEKSGDEVFKTAFDIMLKRYEDKITSNNFLAIQADANTNDSVCWTNQQLLLALELERTRGKISSELDARIDSFIQKCDEGFLKMPHFEGTRHYVRGYHFGKSSHPGSKEFESGYGTMETAHIGKLCCERAGFTTGEVRSKYTNLALNGADVYLTAEPGSDYYAGTLAEVIDFLASVWKLSGDSLYLRRADYFGQIALSNFFGTSDLPKASANTDHYETLAGTDDLVLAIYNLSKAAEGANDITESIFLDAALQSWTSSVTANIYQNDYIKIDAQAAEEWAQFTAALEPGVYEVTVCVKKAADQGIWELKIGGTVQGEQMDFYSDGSGITKFNLGTLDLADSEAVFRFECVGKNTTSSGMLARVDYIELTKKELATASGSSPRNPGAAHTPAVTPFTTLFSGRLKTVSNQVLGAGGHIDLYDLCGRKIDNLDSNRAGKIAGVNGMRQPSQGVMVARIRHDK